MQCNLLESLNCASLPDIAVGALVAVCTLPTNTHGYALRIWRSRNLIGTAQCIDHSYEWFIICSLHDVVYIAVILGPIFNKWQRVLISALTELYRPSWNAAKASPQLQGCRFDTPAKLIDEILRERRGAEQGRSSQLSSLSPVEDHSSVFYFPASTFPSTFRGEGLPI